MYYNQHWAFMAQVAASNLRPGDIVRQLLQNSGVSRQALDLLTILEPIAQATMDMQESGVNLARAVAIWTQLTEKLVGTGGAQVVVARSEQVFVRLCPNCLLEVRYELFCEVYPSKPQKIRKEVSTGTSFMSAFLLYFLHIVHKKTPYTFKLYRWTNMFYNV